MKPLRVAILGARGTGKTWLTDTLAEVLRARGQTVHTSPAKPCIEFGPHPPQACTLEPVHAEPWATTQANGSWQVSDTTPLMTAVCCHAIWDKRDLYPMALAHQALYDITLLTGLDLPVSADLVHADTHPQRSSVDGWIRQALETAGLAYRVVYGLGPQRLNNALLALGLAPEDSAATLAREQGQFAINQGRTVWQCNECSDPGCEHKLFTRLMGQRANK